ncbi:hypothetical protein GPALN_010181 [Globodera pallida]|nr:hypothetical protein GPALN_010181 [Globodera pallida]
MIHWWTSQLNSKKDFRIVFSGVAMITIFLFLYYSTHITNITITIIMDKCQGENMVYSLKINNNKIWPNRTDIKMKGTAFSCELKPLLDKWLLSDKYQITNFVPVKHFSNDDVNKDRPIFVVASDKKFFKFLKGLLVNLKEIFGKHQKIVGYDLGGISENREMMTEVNSVCAMEWRKFDFSLLPENVHGLTNFSWKIAIIAEVLAEYPTVIYLDTKIRFKRKNGFQPYFKQIEQGSISPWVNPWNTGHKIAAATHTGMYKFIPYYWEIATPYKERQMAEASFNVVQRSEHSRLLLKWALLCAATRECIDPPGAKIKCPVPLVGKSVCHRQDQSVINVLSNNLEQEHRINDPNFITHYDSHHPRHQPGNDFFYMEHHQVLNKSRNEFKETVNC